MFGVVYWSCYVLYHTWTCISRQNNHFLPGNNINLLVFSFNVLEEYNYLSTSNCNSKIWSQKLVWF
eukprot:UN10799